MLLCVFQWQPSCAIFPILFWWSWRSVLAISYLYLTKNPIINFSSSALYHTTRRLTVQQRTITIEERISNREKSSASLDPCSHRARDRDLTPSSSFRPSPAAPWIRLENTRNCVGCKNEKNNENVPKYTKKL